MPTYVHDLAVDQFEWRASPVAPKRGVTVWVAEAYDYPGCGGIAPLIRRAYENSSGTAYDRRRKLRVAFDWDAYA